MAFLEHAVLCCGHQMSSKIDRTGTPDTKAQLQHTSEALLPETLNSRALAPAVAPLLFDRKQPHTCTSIYKYSTEPGRTSALLSRKPWNRKPLQFALPAGPNRQNRHVSTVSTLEAIVSTRKRPDSHPTPKPSRLNGKPQVVLRTLIWSPCGFCRDPWPHDNESKPEPCSRNPQTLPNHKRTHISGSHEHARDKCTGLRFGGFGDLFSGLRMFKIIKALYASKGRKSLKTVLLFDKHWSG